MLNEAPIRAATHLAPAYSSQEQRLTEPLRPTQLTEAFLMETSVSATFPISAIARDPHPRKVFWAGLAEASQILAEAEAHKGASLTQAELRVLQEIHLDVYDPDWSFERRGISEEWLAGWSHAFALSAQQIARTRDPEPLHGIGLMGSVRPPLSDHSDQPRTIVHFRQAQITVADPEAFWQGVWEGQITALDRQGGWKVTVSKNVGDALHPLTTARCFDDLLDLFYETGNHGLDFIAGYVLGLSEGLLCGRTSPPASRH